MQISFILFFNYVIENLFIYITIYVCRVIHMNKQIYEKITEKCKEKNFKLCHLSLSLAKNSQNIFYT